MISWISSVGGADTQVICLPVRAVDDKAIVSRISLG
jgi:hypothetical protein